MTKEELLKEAEIQQHYADIMRAAAEGKPIQRRLSGKWHDIDITEYVSNPENAPLLRVKPESTYRPFKNRTEFMAAAKEHGNWIHIKPSPTNPGLECSILPVTVDDFGIIYLSDAGDCASCSTHFTTMLDNDFRWDDDNTPCGVLTDDSE